MAVGAALSETQRAAPGSLLMLVERVGLLAVGSGPPWGRGHPRGLGPPSQAMEGCGGSSLSALLLGCPRGWGCGRRDWFPLGYPSATLGPLSRPRAAGLPGGPMSPRAKQGQAPPLLPEETRREACSPTTGRVCSNACGPTSPSQHTKPHQSSPGICPDPRSCKDSVSPLPAPQLHASESGARAPSR